jgi:hypothetical protein
MYLTLKVNQWLQEKLLYVCVCVCDDRQKKKKKKNNPA